MLLLHMTFRWVPGRNGLHSCPFLFSHTQEETDIVSLGFSFMYKPFGDTDAFMVKTRIL